MEALAETPRTILSPHHHRWISSNSFPAVHLHSKPIFFCSHFLSPRRSLKCSATPSPSLAEFVEVAQKGNYTAFSGGNNGVRVNGAGKQWKEKHESRWQATITERICRRHNQSTCKNRRDCRRGVSNIRTVAAYNTQEKIHKNTASVAVKPLAISNSLSYLNSRYMVRKHGSSGMVLIW